MALLHQELNGGPPPGRAELRRLLASIVACHTGGPARIDCQVEDVGVHDEAVVPLAMIANELVANAVKHAFPAPRSGTVTLSVRAASGGVELAVRDDGAGIDPSARPGLGMRLVELWAEQIGARFVVDGACGTEARVELPAR
jgi:two-component sensor histidine kinase